eukprot:6507851-Prymnesium_polylepis.1
MKLHKLFAPCTEGAARAGVVCLVFRGFSRMPGREGSSVHTRRRAPQFSDATNRVSRPPSSQLSLGATLSPVAVPLPQYELQLIGRAHA